MIIKKITIKNFLQYSHKQEVNFLNKDSSVNVIFGENGSGKSGFINAIKWCLFGKLNDKNKDGDANYINLLNSNSERNKDYEIEVSLFIKHNDSDYVVTRVKNLKKGITEYTSFKDIDEDDLKITKGGKVVEPNKKKSVINELITEEMMTFIFLQGEEIHSIYNNHIRVKQCIEASLRLPQIRKTHNILKAITKDLRDKAMKNGFSDKDFENMQKSKEDYAKDEEILVSYQEALETYDKDINKFNDKYEQHFESLEKRDELQEDISEVKGKINEVSSNIKILSGSLWKVIARNDIENFVNQYPSDLNLANSELIYLLNHSIKDLTCPICEQSTEKVIESLQKKLDKNNSSNSQKSDYSSVFKKKFMNVFEDDHSYTQQINTLNKLKLDLIIKQEDLKNNKLNTSHKDYKTEKSSFEKAIKLKSSVEKDIDDTKKNMRLLKEKIDIYTNLLMKSGNSKTKIEEQLIKVDSYKEFFNNLLNALVDGTKDKVQKIANETFSAILNDIRYKLVINEDFKLEMYESVENGNMHEPSTGQKVVIMYALIYAFRKVAKFEGVLFIDNVFPNLSLSIKKETLETIPKLFNNMILVQLYDSDELNNRIKELSDFVYHIKTDTDKSYSEIIG